MRTSSVSLEGPPTSTPTGRISKAKKGKRVHACEFPGCGKVRWKKATALESTWVEHLANVATRYLREQSTEGQFHTELLL